LLAAAVAAPGLVVAEAQAVIEQRQDLLLLQELQLLSLLVVVVTPPRQPALELLVKVIAVPIPYFQQLPQLAVAAAAVIP
jgi:hypothetical protein